VSPITKEPLLEHDSRVLLQVRLIALVVIVAGLLLWLFRPAGIPPAAQLRDAASVAGFLLLIAAGAGVAAMATVQFWKVLFLPRASFHAIELKSLFRGSTVQVLGLAAPTLKDPDLARSDADLARSRTPKALSHLLDNPMKQKGIQTLYSRKRSR